MLDVNIFQFTSEQQVLIPTYRSKWQKIACSTERIDREKAKLAINKAYEHCYQ